MFDRVKGAKRTPNFITSGPVSFGYTWLIYVCSMASKEVNNNVEKISEDLLVCYNFFVKLVWNQLLVYFCSSFFKGVYNYIVADFHFPVCNRFYWIFVLHDFNGMYYVVSNQGSRSNHVADVLLTSRCNAMLSMLFLFLVFLFLTYRLLISLMRPKLCNQKRPGRVQATL